MQMKVDFAAAGYTLLLLDYARSKCRCSMRGCGFGDPGKTSRCAAKLKCDAGECDAKSRPSKILAEDRGFRQEHRDHRRLSDPVPANRRRVWKSAENIVYVKKAC